MIGIDPNALASPPTAETDHCLGLASDGSSARFETWFIERARTVIREAESAQRDYAETMRQLEAEFNAELTAIEEHAETRLLQLDRQLTRIHDAQRAAGQFTTRMGIRAARAPSPVVATGGVEPDDLAAHVTAIERQLSIVRDIDQQQRMESKHPAVEPTHTAFGWRRLAHALAGLVLVLAVTLFVETHNVTLAGGVALLAFVVFLAGRLVRPRSATGRVAEPVLPQPGDIAHIVEQAEARYEKLTSKVETEARGERSELIRALLLQKRKRSTRHTQRMSDLKPAVVDLANDLERVSPRWQSNSWQAWQPARSLGPAARIGELTIPAAGIPPLPPLFAFPGERALLIKTSAAGKQRADEALRSLLLRLLASTPPGLLHLSLIDPIAFGQNVAEFLRLADVDDRLITGNAATEAQQIERQLVELTGHIERVIQTRLRGRFASIEEYNRDAGEAAVPYRLLAIFDFPTNFSETAARRLLGILRNGPRCGVQTLLVLDQTQALPRGLKLSDIESSAMVIDSDGERFRWREDGFEQCVLRFDRPPDPALFQRLIDGVGTAAVATRTIDVPFRRIAPEPARWWTARADAGISAALGPDAAGSVQALEFGRGTAQHALIVGKTGSGKSTLLHTLITSLALGYHPDDVQLYLVDFKQGVEFKIYAEERLPHARVIAIESEREFGLSVLHGLDDELVRRGQRFRAAGVDNLADYRAQAKEPLPRLLLLVDEFQEFFTDDDQIALQAAQLLDRLVRQGRAFGLHVLLGTQTLAGSYSLARGTIDQMAVRIALQCSDADSRLILADDNPAARLLSRPGDAIYNAMNGLSEGNNRFQVAWLPASDQRRYLTQIRQLAIARGASTGASTVVFEGNAPVDIANNRQLAALIHNRPQIAPDQFMSWLGEPVAIREPVAVVFQRRSGSNLLIVSQNDVAADALLSIGLVSLAAQLPAIRPSFPTLTFLDCGTDTEGVEDLFAHIRRAANLPLRLGRRQHLARAIGEIASEVQRRLDGDRASFTPIFLFIRGLQGARDLRSDERFSYSSFDAEPAAPSLAEQFELILRDGPECGIHTVVWCDTMTNVTRRLDRRALREFGLRVAFQMSADDSVNLVDSAAASKLGPRRALFFDADRAQSDTFRPYAKPAIEWFTASDRSPSADQAAQNGV